ncbi:arylsulfatase B [Ixodes scapularis]|uniref:arylsulfatase B n=1 Tax=Ixodes scapularis TaxID=6945 RepID=UPI001C37F5AD|nr:arylsulfatase B [Ixodes scapularis]
MLRRRALESPGAVAPTHENQNAPSFTPLVVFSVALLLISGAVATGFLLSAGKSPQPHIVFILADDLGWNDVSYNGCPQIRTPNIDALAWNGVRLSRYYTQALCTPSRATLMTGRYPIHTGMQHSIIFNEEPRGLSLSFKLLPQWLAERGYTTHMIGKWHLGFHKTEYTPTKRGFHRHVGLWGAFVDYFTHEKTYRGPGGDTGLDFRRDLSISPNESGTYITQLLTREAKAVIANHPIDKPLFLYLAHQAPHSANPDERLQALKEHIDQYRDIGSWKRTLYAGMVSALDESVGSVFESLNHRGMLDNTVFVFSSDNGADTDSATANSASSWPFRGQKYTPWEGGVRAPAVIWSPLFSGLLGSVYNNMFHISDWLPTLYQLAGGLAEGMADDIDGLSHLHSLTGGTEPPRHELLINIDPVENYSAIIEGHFKLVKGRASGSAFDKWYSIPGNVTWDSDMPRKQCESSVVVRVLRNIGLSPVCGAGRTRYAVPVDCGQRDPREKSCAPERSACLFDLSKDPCEYNDVSGQHPEVVERLLKKLAGYEATALKPANLPDDPRSNPGLHNNVWVAWNDVSGPNLTR